MIPSWFISLWRGAHLTVLLPHILRQSQKAYSSPGSNPPSANDPKYSFYLCKFKRCWWTADSLFLKKEKDWLWKSITVWEQCIYVCIYLCLLRDKQQRDWHKQNAIFRLSCQQTEIVRHRQFLGYSKYRRIGKSFVDITSHFREGTEVAQQPRTAFQRLVRKLGIDTQGPEQAPALNNWFSI